MNGIRLLVLGATAALVFLGVRWLGDVDFDTQPSAEVPSLPTAPISNPAIEAAKKGRRWAEVHQVSSHQTCREGLGKGPEALACHDYVSAQKHIPARPDWRSHATTRTCQAAVNAYWKPILDDWAEKLEYDVVAARIRNGLGPDLKECENIDNIRIIEAIHQPLARIDAMLTQVKAGQALDESEIAQLGQDLPQVEEFRDHKLRSLYLAQFKVLFALLGGQDAANPLSSLNRKADDGQSATKSKN